VDAGAEFDLAVLDYHMPNMDGLMLVDALRQRPCWAKIPVMMLSSGILQKRDVTLRKGHGPFHFISKPLKPLAFRAALEDVISGRENSRSAGTTARPAVLAESVTPLRILLAEDLPVNQKVALRLLKRIGYEADIAVNGVEAVAAAERQEYDVVLMDMQMPEMDGLAATREIRRRRGDSVRPWIIAMTANAMEGDRESCLAAGMNDYISKPVQISALASALETVARQAASSGRK
jgi:CheY-like chemotaxis protein